MTWSHASLTALGTIERGRSRHRPRNDPLLFGEGMPFFQTGDVKAATLHLTSASQGYSDFGVAQSRIWEPGTTCITIAANIADSAVLGVPGCFPDSILGFTPTEQADDAYFVKYLLDVHRERLTAMAHGTTQDNLSVEKLLSHAFLIPDAITRSRIAHILRSIDDLIENNRRRIELLEQMAQVVYREWFVRFRYPGHKDVTLVGSPLGPIPEGWVPKAIEDVSESITRGIAPRYADSGPWTVINQRCIRHSRLSLDVARRQERDVPSAKQVRSGDILVNSTGVGTLGRVGVVLREHGALTADSHVTIVRPTRTRLQPWFGMNMLLRQVELETLGVGSTGQTELGRQSIGRLPIVLPPDDVLSMFADLAWPMVLAVPHLIEHNHKLAAIRDLLLPRLVTGQIDVSELDLDVLAESVA